MFMLLKKRPTLTDNACRKRVVILAFFWICGLLLGVYFGVSAKDVLSPLMRTAVLRRVSIVGLSAILIFPLLLSAGAVYFSVPQLIFFISFIKAFCLGYVSIPLAACFGTASWLICRLLMFSDFCMIIVLFWFWIKCMCGSIKSLRKDFFVCCVIALSLVMIDYLFVSPFLSALVNN